MNRRAFLMGLAAAAAPAMGAAGEIPHSEGNGVRYIAAYDTESPRCLAACRKIAEKHRKHRMPATFFITGATLEANPDAYRELLDDPLFEIASHTYSHRMLLDHPICGGAISMAEIKIEIENSKQIIERVFGRPCLGFRPACGFDNGFRGHGEILSMLEKSGYRYVSSLLWGPDYSLPANLTEPFNYAPEGFEDLWEIPGHGWHENLLKNNNKMGPARITLWPPAMPEAIPEDFIETPEEEFAINRIFMDKAAESRMPYVSFIWHPWSLMAFDPEMRMLDLTFDYARERGFHCGTFVEFRGALAA